MHLSSRLSLFGLAAAHLVPGVAAYAARAADAINLFIVSPQGLETCLTANGNFDGAAVTMAPCGRVSTFVKTWTVEKGGANPTGPPSNIRIFGDKCLDVTNGLNQNGAKLQIWTCGENNPNQLFNANWDGSFSWAGKGKCVDVTDGHFGDGTQLQVWSCAKGNTHQTFTTRTLQTTRVIVELQPIRANSIPWCMTATSNTDGAPIILQLCSGDKASQQQFFVPQSGFGLITLYNGTKCLDVRDGKDANGTPLQLWSCVRTSSNQQWINSFLGTGNPLIQWAHHGKCVSATDRKDGAAIQLLDCGTGNNHTWSEETISG